ncbi:MAG: hypothetical protein RLZZ611_294 [Cyanobacteriota bacterium]|jgi:hypothetical protein
MPREYAIVQVLGSGPDAFIMHQAGAADRWHVTSRNTAQATGPMLRIR